MTQIRIIYCTIISYIAATATLL